MTPHRLQIQEGESGEEEGQARGALSSQGGYTLVLNRAQRKKRKQLLQREQAAAARRVPVRGAARLGLVRVEEGEELQEWEGGVGCSYSLA